MPQVQFPFFPEGVTHITSLLAFAKRDGRVTYFNGNMPVFIHDEADVASFRMITAQFVVSGHASQAQIARAFGVAKISVKRAVKRYREQGPKGFYAPKKTRGAAVLTAGVLDQAQRLLDEGVPTADVADQLGIKRDTLSKAVRAGRLHARAKPEGGTAALLITTKSERTGRDSQAPMGMGAINVAARVAASVGALDAVAPQFVPAVDVPYGGVLFALPALLALGLIDSTPGFLELPKGYYGLDSLMILLAFMALARLNAMEQLRYCAPGEWGKLLGLDRVPEVRTLRAKIRLLGEQGKAEPWSAALSQRWMQAAPEQAGTLYVDGHVRVYHGDQTELPRHYVARQRLCLRATTDYWVNAMDGQPFFVVNQAVDPGLIHVLEQHIVPRLEREVPGQPDTETLAAQPLLHRFTLVFDREGYSPQLLERMKAKRIACLSYHKFPGEPWAGEEFREYPVSLPSGQCVSMRLAERGTWLSNGLWVREIRKLSQSAHQTAILSTDYTSDLVPVATAMFSRWAQENFFKYARENFGLDRLVDYRTQAISEPIRVVNPAYRSLDSQVRSTTGKLHRLLAQFGALNIEQDIDPKRIEPVLRKKADLQERIEQLQAQLDTLKTERKATEHHIAFEQLPEPQRFRQLSTQSKHLIDTIKMIAYRAETAMANILGEHLSHRDDTRALLRALYATEADLLPDDNARTLTVRLHHLPNEYFNAAIRKLCDELNATETLFPRTDLRLVLKLGSSQNRRDQDL
jgi:transposase-like protein